MRTPSSNVTKAIATLGVYEAEIIAGFERLSRLLGSDAFELRRGLGVIEDIERALVEVLQLCAAIEAMKRPIKERHLELVARHRERSAARRTGLAQLARRLREHHHR